MKRIKYILFVALVFATNSLLAQPDTLYIVNSIAVDSDGNGMTDAIEFEFNQPVNDASMFTSLNTGSDWSFSSYPDMSNSYTQPNVQFFTDVDFIAKSDEANDKYVRLYINNQSGGDIKDNAYDTLFYEYTYDAAYKVYAYYQPTKYLRDTLGYGNDKSAPEIESVTFSPNTGTLGIGDSLVVSVNIVHGSNTTPEEGLLADTIIINGTYVPSDSLIESPAGTYKFRYWVDEGDNNVANSDTIIFSIVLKDTNGNKSKAFTDSPDASNCPTIDTNRPGVANVYFTPGNGNVVGIDETVRVDIFARDNETGLTPTLLTVNNVDISGTFHDDGGGQYYAIYTVQNTDIQILDSSKLPFEIALTDGVNISDTLSETDLSIDISPGIDPVAPSISGIIFYPGNGNKVGIGDTVFMSITASEALLGVKALTINGRNFAYTFTDSTGGKYGAYYIVKENDTENTDAQKLPFSITITDGANDVTYTQDDFIDNSPAVDSKYPVISGVTFDPNSTIRVINQTITLTITANENNLIKDSISVNGKSVGFSGTGPSYTAIYTIQEGDNDISDDQAIPIYIKLSDGANVSSVYTTSSSGTCPGIDANRPAIDTVISDATVADVLKIGDKINFTVDIIGLDGNLTITPLQYNGQDLNWFTSDGGGTYKGIYTVTEGDTDQSGPLQLTGVKATDLAGNESDLADGGDIVKTIDANRPVILDVTSSTAGGSILGIGESITFTVDVETTETGLTILPSKYNGQDLNWTAISSGDYYEGTYTVGPGDQDRTSPLQLTGVTATDVAGNISLSFDGSDVSSTIDANKPAIDTVTSDATVAGILKIGDKINFTVDIIGLDGNLTITPSQYNGQDLNWYTSDGGSTYKGVYTVTEGDTDQSGPQQLTGVKATDLAGNESDLAHGGDIAKTIDANRPEIVLTELKNESKNIGDRDTLYIKITSDSDYVNYSLISGTIAGYSIDSIRNFNDTTILAYFTITARSYEIDSTETVPINNLQLADGAGNVSNIINTSVPNPNHAIFSKRPIAEISGSVSVCDNDSIEVPVSLTGHAPFSITYTDGITPVTINSIYTNPFKLKIIADYSKGSPLNYTITTVTDATGNTNNTVKGPYTLTINELPNAYFISPTDGNTFDVSIDSVHLSAFPGGAGGVFSGDAVISAFEMFSPEIAGVNIPGDPHILYYNYTDANGCKDADTISIDVIEGGSITFLQGKEIYCNYTDSFRIVGYNNLGLPGSFVLEDDPGGAIHDYGNDTAVIYPKLLEIRSYKIYYSYGSSPVVTINRSFSIEKVSDAITFTAIGNKCEDYDRINIEAKNLSPLGGNGYFSFSEVINLHETNSGNNIYIEKGDLNPGVYTIEYYYLSTNSCSSDTLSETFTVHQLPSVDLTMDALYDINGGTHIITGDPVSPPGSFSPSFMLDNGDGTAVFDPELAGTGNKKAYYTHTDLNGCTNIDSAMFIIDQAKGTIEGLNKFETNNQYCYFNSQSDTVWAKPLNSDGTPGTFYIDGTEITNVVGIKDTIAFIPSEIGPGNHILQFKYTNGTVLFTLEENFNIDSIGNLEIIGLDRNYCKDDNRQITLTGIYTGDIGVGIFSGNGIVGNKFTPENANLGDNIINYTFTRAYSGCVKSVDSVTTVNKVPFIDFSLDKTCIVNRQDSVTLTSDTLMADGVVQWEWTVDNTITNRSSDLEIPKFSMVEQVKNFISLTLTTNKGCSAQKDESIFIGSVVDLDFKWDNECFGDAVNFEVTSYTDPAGVDSIKWNFGGTGTSIISDEYNPQFTYDNPGAYNVVYQEYTANCGLVSETKTVNIRPSVDLSAISYIEDFENAPEITGWAVDVQTSTSNYSWQWGIPSGEKIDTAASGLNAYVTNLDGNYSNNEISYVSSPCFDFTQMEKPMLSFDFISDLELNKDGVILEYSVTKDEWNTVGVYGEGVNWYNSFGIGGSVLGQSSGWTGDGKSLNTSFVPTWNNARYWLDDLKGHAGVQFRFVLGTDNSTLGEGFGFDNIQIGERNRLVLLEHFANPEENDFENTQSLIENISSENKNDVTTIQYFTSFPKVNEISEFYAAGPSARSLYYGVSQVPYSIIDGGDRKFNYSSTNTLDGSDIKKRMLQNSVFYLDVKQGISGENLNISTTVKAIENIEQADYSVRILVGEKSVLSNNFNYYNILRAMLPDPAGTLLERSWNADDSVKLFHSWVIPSELNADSLFVIAFIQNEDSKEIYQAAYTSEFGVLTSDNEFKESLSELDYLVYPNPANETVNLKFIGNRNSDLKLNIYNNTGYLVKTVYLPSDIKDYNININDLPVGIYFLKLDDGYHYSGTTKIIKL